MIDRHAHNPATKEKMHSVYFNSKILLFGSKVFVSGHSMNFLTSMILISLHGKLYKLNLSLAGYSCPVVGAVFI